MIRFLVLAAVAACVVELGASADTGPLRGSVTSIDKTWVCNKAVDLDSVSVTMTPAAPGGASATDAIHLESGCTGRIGRIEVTTSVADGVKVAQGAHDLAIGGGRVRCLAKTPSVHQDGIQVMGGSKITLTGVIVDCGRLGDDLINSNLFVNMAGDSTEPPADVVCDACVFGAGAAHTVSIQNSVRSGVTDSTVCPARFPKQTLSIGAAAVDPLNDGNRVGPCSGPLLSLVAGATAATYGQPVVLTGWIVALDPQPLVSVEARPAGKPGFGVQPGSVTADGNGAWQLAIRPGVTTTFRASADGSTSSLVLVQVRPRLSLKLRKGVLFGSVLAGRSLRGRKVVLEQRQGTGWTAIGSYRPDAKSTVTIVPRVRHARVRLSIGPTPGYLPAVSPSVFVPSA